MDHLPVFLQLRSRRAVVIGGGPLATRKIDLLLRTGAHVTVVAPNLSTELQSLTSRGRLQHIGTEFRPDHLANAAIVIAATSDREVNVAVSVASRERGIPVNVVDNPELSSFIFPAIVDRSPLVVALSSGGRAPVLARRLRERIEALVPERLGALARFMGKRREAVRQALSASARRPFWERIVDGAVGTRVLGGDPAGAAQAFERELLASQLTSTPERPALGEVYLIGAGPGDPDLLTLRALQLLQQSDVVLYDRLVTPAVLERARRDAKRIFVGKNTGEHDAQARIHELMLSFAAQGLRVARLKGGDPFIFGRGGEELEVLAAHGIPYIVVPGITAALGAAASAGIPLTHRRLAQSVTFVTGHRLDEAPLDWRALASAHQTVVFYMAVAQLPEIVAKLRLAGASAEVQAALIERATLPGQRLLHGRLENIAELAREAQVKPPALLIVGDVAAFAATEALNVACAASTVALA